MVDRIAAVVSRCALLTEDAHVHIVIPSPICAGVLGMTRMMPLCRIPSANDFILVPATMDIIDWPLLNPPPMSP